MRNRFLAKCTSALWILKINILENETLFAGGYFIISTYFCTNSHFIRSFAIFTYKIFWRFKNRILEKGATNKQIFLNSINIG